MSPERWQQVAELCDSALSVESAGRSRFLDEACGGDRLLRQEVEALLAGENEASEFLESPAVEVAASMLASPDSAETLSPGLQIGPFQILERIGGGGMGQVYRATDTRLGRDVAIKVLPTGALRDSGGLERFRREARAASALSHVNICPLYDIGEYEGQPFLIMELLEGQSLKERLIRGPLPPQEAVALAVQIADALHAAHAKGIVHRDIKPGNILLVAQGQAKILDFGLAKLLSERKRQEAGPDVPPPVAAGEATITIPGRTMGTVAYMSPEQARGEAVDERTDLFSLGVTLYEMATGARPFAGETSAMVLDAIVTREPARPRKLNPAIPAELERIILKALEKDQAVRYQRAAELRADLEALQSPKRLASRRFPVVALLLALAVASFAIRFGWFDVVRQPPAPVFQRLTSDSGLTTDPALSADGTLLAYASDRSGDGNLDIYLRKVGSAEAVRLTQDAADEHEPAFSPDGARIAFRSERNGGGIDIVPVSGGTVKRIVSGGRRPRFSPDGNWIAYWTGSVHAVGFHVRNRCRIYVVPSDGGTPREVRPDFAGASYPVWSPDGKYVLFLGSVDDKLAPENSVDWWITPVGEGSAVKTGVLEVTRKAGLYGSFLGYPWALIAAAWAPGAESLVFSARSGDSTNLWRIGISPKTFKATGPPMRLTTGLTLEENASVTPAASVAVRVAFASLNNNLDIWSLPIDANRGMVLGDIQQVTKDASDDFHPGLSPDGRKMVFVSSRSGAQQIWVKDLRTNQNMALTSGGRANKWLPRFSPDGSRLSYAAVENNQWNVYVVPATGGAPELVCEDCGEVTDWSSDGRRIIGNDVFGRVWLFDLVARRKSEIAALAGRWLAPGRFSPDYRWVALLDNVPRYSYITPFEADTPIVESSLIADTEGLMLYWSPNGNLIYGYSELRDGYLCLWARRLDAATKRPIGPPFAIYHSHNVRRALANQSNLHPFVGRDRILFSMGERTGNIWMADWEKW